jgi:hypothetical protein
MNDFIKDVRNYIYNYYNIDIQIEWEQYLLNNKDEKRNRFLDDLGIDKKTFKWFLELGKEFYNVTIEYETFLEKLCHIDRNKGNAFRWNFYRNGAVKTKFREKQKFVKNKSLLQKKEKKMKDDWKKYKKHKKDNQKRYSSSWRRLENSLRNKKERQLKHQIFKDWSEFL